MGFKVLRIYSANIFMLFMTVHLCLPVKRWLLFLSIPCYLFVILSFIPPPGIFNCDNCPLNLPSGESLDSRQQMLPS